MAKVKLKNLKGAAREKRIRELISNPATRHHVPSRDLPDDLRREREKRAYLETPISPGSDVTRRDAAHEREATTRLAFQPREADLARQLQDSVARERKAADYFSAYQADLRAMVERQARDAAQFADASKRIGDAGQAADTQQARELQTQAEADARMRGATADPEALARAAQASQVRRSETDQFGRLMTTQAASAHQALAAREATVPLMGLQASRREGDVRAQLGRDASDLAAAKGDYRAKAAADIRDREHRAGLERIVFEDQAADRAADNARMEQEARSRRFDQQESRRLAREREQRQAAEAERQAGFEERRLDQTDERIADSRDNGGRRNGTDRYGNTPRQRRAAQDEWSRYLSGARKAASAGKSEAEILSMLDAYDVNPTVARGIAQYVTKGRIGPKTRRRLRERGVQPPARLVVKQKGTGEPGTGHPS